MSLRNKILDLSLDHTEWGSQLRGSFDWPEEMDSTRQGQIIHKLLDVMAIADQPFMARVTLSDERFEDDKEAWIEGPCWFDKPWICFDADDSHYNASHENIGHLYVETFRHTEQSAVRVDLQSPEIQRIEILPV